MLAVARVGIALLALAVGVVLGTVTTFAHAMAPPWALLAGLLVLAGYVLGARLAFGERMPGAAAALGVVAPVVLIAVLPQDLVVLHPDEPLAVAWLVAAPLTTAGAALWPLPSEPDTASEAA